LFPLAPASRTANAKMKNNLHKATHSIISTYTQVHPLFRRKEKRITKKPFNKQFEDWLPWEYECNYSKCASSTRFVCTSTAQTACDNHNEQLGNQQKKECPCSKSSCCAWCVLADQKSCCIRLHLFSLPECH
jgi:hypothetical protein